MQDSFKYAGFWIRAVADFIDSILLDIAAALILLMGVGAYFWIGVLLGKGSQGGVVSFYEALDPFRFQIVFAVIRVAMSFFYFTWLTYWFGTTAGKRILHVYVVSKTGFAPVTLKQSMIRCFAYVLSYIPFGAGFLMVAFQPEKRALHDLIAGTVSIIKPKQVEHVEPVNPEGKLENKEKEVEVKV